MNSFQKRRNISRAISPGIIWLFQLMCAVYVVIWLINPINGDLKYISVVIIIWLGLGMLCRPYSMIRSIKKIIPISAIWIIIMLLYALAGHSKFSMSYIMYAFCPIIALYYMGSEDKQAAIVLLLTAIGYLAIIEINTLIQYELHPSLSRALSVGDLKIVESYGLIEYVTPFIATYETVYSLLLIIFPFLFLFKYCRKSLSLPKQIVLLSIVVLFYIGIIKSQFFYALLFLLTTSMIFLVNLLKNQKDRVFCYFAVVFALLLFVMFSDFIFAILIDLHIGDNTVTKLRELMSFGSNIRNTTSDVGFRLALYLKSINTVFTFPLFGSGIETVRYQYIGHHSTILDFLAQYGFIGGTAILAYYIHPMQVISKEFSWNGKRAYKYSMIILFVYSMVNYSEYRSTLAMMYIVAPFLCYLIGSVNDYNLTEEIDG